MYVITDNAGTSGTAVVAGARDIADTIRPWYPDAPAEVLAAVDDLEAAILADHPRQYDVAAFLALTVDHIDRAEVDLADDDLADWFAGMPQLGPRVVDTEGTVAYLTGEQLVVLAGLPKDVDGHYDGRQIWIGGRGYEVTECGAGAPGYIGAPRMGKTSHPDWAAAPGPAVVADKRMTAAEFRITREYLGLTTAWLADRLDVRERTVHRWEAGESPIPVRVGEDIEAIAAETAGLVGRLIDDCADTPDRGALLTYRTDADYRAHYPESMFPASWHRAVVARVRAQVPGLAVDYWAPDLDTDA